MLCAPCQGVVLQALGAAENPECRIDLLHPDWPGIQLHYRFHETLYHIDVSVLGPPPHQTQRVWLDEPGQPDGDIPLVDDHNEHFVRLELA